MGGLLLRRVRLVGGARPGPVDLRVVGGEVAEVAPSLARAPGEAEHDAEGRWLVPGLWDHHVHLGQWALMRRRLDLSGARSAAEAARRVADRVASSEGPVVGFGHRPATWAEPPSVGLLDTVSGDRPVVLVSGDAHHGWINSAGLAALGLAAREGVVAEEEWFAAMPRVSSLLEPDAGSVAAYVEVQREAAARGVVGVVDLEVGMGPDDWAERAAAGGRLLRIRTSTYPERLAEHLERGLRTGDVLGDSSAGSPGGDPLLTMGPLKVISDGSLNTRTAWCCAPYADCDTHGAPNLGEEELTSLLALASGRGLEVAVHAIGDAAVARALDAFAATGARGSIEHAQLMARTDVRRMGALGVAASVQPAHLLDDRDLTARSWPDRGGRCFMLRSMLDAGVRLRLGSDAPVAPLDPWLAMAAAVHRSGDSRRPWHPEQAITAAEALDGSVASGLPVRPGLPADLVLLEDEPLGAGPDTSTAETATVEVARRLRTMRVAATWIAGRRV